MGNVIASTREDLPIPQYLCPRLRAFAFTWSWDIRLCGIEREVGRSRVVEHGHHCASQTL